MIMLVQLSQVFQKTHSVDLVQWCPLYDVHTLGQYQCAPLARVPVFKLGLEHEVQVPVAFIICQIKALWELHS